MDTRRFLTGTIVGAIVLYGVGHLIWKIVFLDFFAANAGSASGLPKDPQVLWALALGYLGYAALITWVMLGRGGATTIGGGFLLGGIAGFLMWFAADFILYAVANLSNLTATIVDPALEFVHGGMAGAAIAVVAGKPPR